ncbi:MAG: dihydrolipoyl dehydrogenase [Chloroflexi bacterium]|nr:dihydrolipoyl dehydrogenase [Chloroflexota bacterium]
MAAEYDIVIVGGGPGGYVSAIRASQLGAKVALVEKDRLGGTCLNRGCIPTKALVRSVEALQEAKKAHEFGVETGEVSLNFPQVMARKQQVVDSLVTGIEQLVAGRKIELYKGTGRLTSPRSLTVNGQEVSGRNVILATGSVPARIPIPGLDLPGVVTSDELLEVKEVPESLAIIGGGIIGMEFACIFRALGCQVTVIEMLPMILPPVDEEIARRFTQMARQQGIQIHTGATVTQVREWEGMLEVVFNTAQGEMTAPAEMVLVSVGRTPYTQGLGLEETGIAMNRRAIAANEAMETNLEGVYAIGDVIGGIMLAHVASYEGEVAVDNALGHRRTVDYGVVPNCVFTSPEIAAVGMTEKEIKDKDIPYKVSRFPFSALGRAQVLGETVGLVKTICQEGTGKVLGVHIMGPRATDLIAEGAAVMHHSGTARDIAHTIHAHPTLPEAMMEAALGQLEGSIHLRRM